MTAETLTTPTPAAPHTTHTVFNQAPPRRDVNEFTLNTALNDAVDRYAPQASRDELERLGGLVVSACFIDGARLANDHGPQLRTHDEWGNRLHDIEFHPPSHRIIGEALRSGAPSHAWTHPGPGANVERAARFMLLSQIEPGHACPVSMTHAVVPPLQADRQLADSWLPKVQSH